MAGNKRIILITGANAGIGFETANQLLNDVDTHIVIGSRSQQKGEAALKDLRSRNLPGSVELVHLDVTDKKSIEAAVDSVESQHGRLDVLVNNAAIATVPDALIDEQFRSLYDTNVIGPYNVTEKFRTLLEKSKQPRVVNVSSGAGSLGNKADKTNPLYKQLAPAYRASKSALNMITLVQRTEYEDLGFKFFLVCPGFTVSNLSSYNKVEQGAKPTSEGAKVIVETAQGERDMQEGTFYNQNSTFRW